MAVALGAGLAVSGAAPAADWRASVGGDLRWFDWREYQGGQQLLMERGPMAEPELQLELQQGHWFTRLNALWGGGFGRYNGHLQSGPAYTADTGEEIIDVEARLGWRSEKGGIHLGFMQRDWRRFINGSATVSSAEERYRWRLVTLGGEAGLLHSPVWRMALNLGLPVSSYQKVYSGNADDFSLEPGDGFYWRLSFPFHAAGNALSLEPYYQEQYMQASDPVMLTLNGVPQNRLAYQPDSVRRELGVTLRWQFGSGSFGR